MNPSAEPTPPLRSAPNESQSDGKGGQHPGANAGHGSSSDDAGSSELAAARKKIEELEAQVREKESKYLYLYADFENFKKRTIKERSDLLKFGWENLAHDLLEVLDNLERAVAHAAPGTDKNLLEGINLTLTQFRSSLSKQGVQEVKSLNAAFDPNFHEAVAQEPSEKHPAGTITQEHHRGYTLHGRLLRPARVTVSGGSS